MSASPSPLTSGLQRFWQDSTPFVRIIMALNIAVYVIPAMLDWVGIRYKSMPVSDILLIWGAKDNIAIAAADQYYRFLTMMFLHGGVLHLLFNTLAISSIGSDVERMTGSQRFLFIYFVGGFAGGVASYVFTANPSVGASGAVFALVGAALVFFLLNRKVFGGDARQYIANILFMAVINIGIGLSAPNIDNMAHIGGFIGGLVTGFCLMPRMQLVWSADGEMHPVRQIPSWAWYGIGVFFVVLFVVVATVIPAVDFG
ncbi:MAG: rhomboid family intramembrane serine protease [Roseiflexaceae bacterium]